MRARLQTRWNYCCGRTSQPSPCDPEMEMRALPLGIYVVLLLWSTARYYLIFLQNIVNNLIIERVKLGTVALPKYFAVRLLPRRQKMAPKPQFSVGTCVRELLSKRRCSAVACTLGALKQCFHEYLAWTWLPGAFGFYVKLLGWNLSHSTPCWVIVCRKPFIILAALFYWIRSN